MAFTKKKKRRMDVDGHLLYWSATGDDGWINLCLLSEFEGSGKVFASFEYHQTGVTEVIDGHSYTALFDQFVITPYIVRQVVQLAFSRGWKPLEKGDDLHLGPVDSLVDLRLDQNRASCFKKAS